jgi:conjugative relaxase-like TrwC/TraI family protein
MVAAVLRIAKVRSGGAGYYLGVAAGSGTGIEVAGRWTGRGPTQFDLQGTVQADDLEAVLAGEHPETGRLLGSARTRVRVAGFDMTFSAPKSVSLLHALGDPEISHAVGSAHDHAVEAAMSYVEDRALAVRRRTDRAPVDRPVPVAVEAVPAAAFVHRLSRALDPHLHTHVVVANLGRDADGIWSALDGRGVYAHASTTDGLYHADLRFELTRRLGVAWNPPDRGRADIAGIAPEVRREFSRRATDIAAHLTEHGGDGGRAATMAAHVTRAEKDPLLAAEDLQPQWRERASAVGLGPRRLDAVLDRAPRRSSPSWPSARQAEAHRPVVSEALAELNRPVTRRDVVRAWCRSLPDGAPALAVEEAADRHLDVMTPETGARGRWQGPGVAERRHDPPAPDLARTTARELSRRLAGRGIGLDRADHRRRDSGLGLG